MCRRRDQVLVEEESRSLVLTLYGARASVDAIAFAGNDSLIRTIGATRVVAAQGVGPSPDKVRGAGLEVETI